MEVPTKSFRAAAAGGHRRSRPPFLVLYSPCRASQSVSQPSRTRPHRPSLLPGTFSFHPLQLPTIHRHVNQRSIPLKELIRTVTAGLSQSSLNPIITYGYQVIPGILVSLSLNFCMSWGRSPPLAPAPLPPSTVLHRALSLPLCGESQGTQGCF